MRQNHVIFPLSEVVVAEGTQSHQITPSCGFFPQCCISIFVILPSLALLVSYYHNAPKRLRLCEFLDIKKETMYWWFVNRNKQKRKAIKTKLRMKWHVQGKKTCWSSFSGNSWMRKGIKGGMTLGKIRVRSNTRFKLEKLEKDPILECHTQHLYWCVSRSLCYIEEDKVDGWYRCNVWPMIHWNSTGSKNKSMTWVWFWCIYNINYAVLWLDSMTDYKIGITGQRRQCVNMSSDGNNMQTQGKHSGKNIWMCP